MCRVGTRCRHCVHGTENFRARANFCRQVAQSKLRRTAIGDVFALVSSDRVADTRSASHAEAFPKGLLMSKLRVLLLPLLLLVPAANSESAPIFYDFTLEFTTGGLDNQSFDGSFSVDGNDCPGGVCPESFVPDDDAHTLLSFDITVAGETFDNEDATFYPEFPRVGFTGGNVSSLDFVQGFLHFCWLSLLSDLQ